MLYAQKVAAALEAKRGSFVRLEDTFTQELAAYRAALAGLGRAYPRRSDLEARLAAAEGGVGARPLAQYDAWIAAGQPQLPVASFGRSFAHHEAARAWAEKVITGVTTVAVDGSQIMPWRDASIPVALVQAGIFVNPHDGARPYVKDVVVDVLGPEDLALLPEDQDDPDVQRLGTEEIVNLRRFELETRTLAAWMRDWRGGPGEKAPVAIFDGSLIVSFAHAMLPRLRERYIAAVTDLLAASAAARVPLVGYIDTSLARDLVKMLHAVSDAPKLPETKRIHDALLWGDALQWGDYTEPFLSARGDVLPDYPEKQASIAFAYLRAAGDRPPARLEFPRWVVESDLFAHTLDALRAELIAGTGYPYAIETADAVAVISIADRSRFYQQFQRFAEGAGLPLTFSRKSLSKSRRR